MTQHFDVFTLPAGPKDLCFDKNEFMKKIFSVDEFLQENRNAANLETLRDDLGIYLKVLRSAMIELINKDYGDFVNLSANLIGLDQSINSIQTPLGQLKEEVLSVKLSLTDAMTELNDCLCQRKHLRDLKLSLQYLSQIQKSISKLSDLLKMKQPSPDLLEPVMLERAASAYNQLQFSISRCNHVTLQHRELNLKISQRIMKLIDNFFMDSLTSNDIERLSKCLKIYVSLGKISEAETLFRREIVAPEMHDIISESSLQLNPRGLQGVLDEILMFVEKKMKVILNITQPSNLDYCVKGFNFVINSFWPEVETRLENHMSSIFAPGNPEMFYQKFMDANNFLHKIEEMCGSPSCISQLRDHAQYKSFQQRWNLPVYFQIRFQEIGGALESVFMENISFVESSDRSLGLLQTSTTWDCLLRCWASGVFLHQLSNRFWKLSLQILSRYYTWTSKVILSYKDISKSTSDAADMSEPGSKTAIKRVLLVALYTDIVNLVNRLPTFLTIAENSLKLSTNNRPLLQASLDESTNMLRSRLPDINNEIINEISSESSVHIRQVQDIPRLFRKTNREIPNKACPYIGLILDGPIRFYKEYSKDLGSELTLSWLNMIFSAITTQLHVAIKDVLTSVQKTEESLRRLKQIRDRSVTTSTYEKSGLSDDDKIRLQLRVDVLGYCSGIEAIGIARQKVEKLTDLIMLVEEATKLKTIENK